MPHGESWWSRWFAGTPIWENLARLVETLNFHVTGEHDTWMADEPTRLHHVFGAMLVVLVLAAFAAISYSGVKNTQAAIVPEGKLTIRTFVELFVGVCYSMMSDIMGAKAARYFLPLIGTCAFFILFSNALGMVPGFTPPTDTLSTTVVLALVIFFATHIYGLYENGFNHIKHLFGPIIKWYALPLMLLMFVIEVISHFARPLSLSLRLMANMFADHLVVGVFLGLVPFLVPVPIMLLGTLVVVVQTLVFCILSTVYIGLAIQHEEH
jgi:F-type H+-transporting ATPase subunit a